MNRPDEIANIKPMTVYTFGLEAVGEEVALSVALASSSMTGEGDNVGAIRRCGEWECGVVDADCYRTVNVCDGMGGVLF